jgi:lipopolysaccharide/colanic/teichoic acid biosynthesis glycosyltransferase
MEEAYRELQALQECAGNHERIVLLQNIYRGDRRHYWLRKRLVDMLASTLGLIVLTPVLLLISLAIVLDDPKGGPFFKQTRVGRHKKYFLMYKFRTMCVDAEAKKEELEKLNEKDGPVFKIAKDPRITRVGQFLRSTSLDELPQLFNILKGQMTLVGPRPPLPSEVGNYTRYDEMRLSVTPGLTCVWQVQPNRDDIPFAQWVDMDLAYIGTRSIWLDIRLIMKTALAVFHKHGS